MKRSLMLLSVLLPFGLHGQTNQGPRYTALGNTGVAIQGAWSLQSNQAGITGIHRPVAAVAIESRFITTGLFTKSAVLVVPFQQQALGVSFQSYGFSAYTEQRAGLAYARRFGNAVSFALDFNYHQLSVPDYGSIRTYSVEAGMHYQASENVLIGAHIANPTQSTYENQSLAAIPTKIDFGASYQFSDKLLICAALSKMLLAEADAGFGLEYALADKIALRGGLSVNPLRQYAGFGLNYHKIKIDVAATSHPVLGFSPQLALSYEF